MDVADYKAKGLKQDDLRRRREEQQVEIRRQKRDETIAKRRNLDVGASPDSDDELGGSTFDAPVRTLACSLCGADIPRALLS
jgi:importin subunit alpha-1